jgi:hypothetical protein
MGAGRIVGTNETRKYRRASVHWPATLACRDASMRCVIANLSANGVKVMVDDPSAVPARVTLSCDRFGALAGDIIWRSPSALGIRFVLAPDLVATVLGDTLPVLPGRSGAAT